jgi:uncharacterized protein YebE (UPF0316 family)
VLSLVGSVLPAGVALPLTVFLAEMCVVTLSTIRIIFISRGRRLLGPLLGFFEVVIWLFAIGQTMQNLTNPACYIAFAAGFTAGSYCGVMIERRLALGTVVIRIITNKDTADLVDRLHVAGYGVTRLDGEGLTGPVKVIFTVVPRRDLGTVTALIRAADPKLFYSVDEIQTASEGVFPSVRGRPRLLAAARRTSAGTGASWRPGGTSAPGTASPF